ncbi:hypothetical protein BRARA_H02187 [Brassica rapa]|uniref:Uncharacterized protein n=1 Tax=Brassica campestris TaxID=3711 RepID=A0A397YNL3_BRACM|nr:hypothetical protein BRARA_H02187 [Brassica rapa]
MTSHPPYIYIIHCCFSPYRIRVSKLSEETVETRLAKSTRNVLKSLFFGDVMLVWDRMSYTFD